MHAYIYQAMPPSAPPARYCTSADQIIAIVTQHSACPASRFSNAVAAQRSSLDRRAPQSAPFIDPSAARPLPSSGLAARSPCPSAQPSTRVSDNRSDPDLLPQRDSIVCPYTSRDALVACLSFHLRPPATLPPRPRFRLPVCIPSFPAFALFLAFPFQARERLNLRPNYHYYHV
jgi:hypothetical protein